MIKQFRNPLLLFLFGCIITIFGAWAKIMHYALADIALTAGMLLQAAALVYLIYILLKTK